MPEYTYEARTSDGRSARGALEALNQERAVRLLQEQNLTVIRVTEVAPRWDFIGDIRQSLHRWGYERVEPRDIALFTRQLALLLAAGVPVLQALESLRDQIWSSAYFVQICESLIDSVHQGKRLSLAFSAHPRVFSETYVSLVRAGEASGTLVEILDRLSGYLERNYRLSQKLKSALVYPALVFTLSVVLVFLLCSYILPMFLQFFDGMALRMPSTTRNLMAAAVALGNPWVVSAFAACLPLVAYQVHLLCKLSHVRRRLEVFLFDLPIIGYLFVQVVSARFCRTASILLDCGLGQMQTLDLLGDVAGSSVVSGEIEEMRTNIRDGQGSFSSELLETSFFPPICGHMVCAAEESGSMPKIFERLADFFDEAIENGITRVLALIEPIMLATMGLLVGFILICVFQPIYGLLEAM